MARKKPAPVSNPTRVTETIRLTGRCSGPGRHNVWHDATITRTRGAIHTCTAEADCPTCGRLTQLQGIAGP